jgi:hypothetical protein
MCIVHFKELSKVKKNEPKITKIGQFFVELSSKYIPVAQHSASLSMPAFKSPSMRIIQHGNHPVWN